MADDPKERPSFRQIVPALEQLSGELLGAAQPA